jgi:hypothetical protein
MTHDTNLHSKLLTDAIIQLNRCKNITFLRLILFYEPDALPDVQPTGS